MNINYPAGSIVASRDAQIATAGLPVVWDYVSNFKENGFDGFNTFNQFAKTIKYYCPWLSFLTSRGKALELSTPNNYAAINMVRLSPGTPSIPTNARKLILGIEVSFKGLQNQGPYAFRFGIDTQVENNRGWGMIEYRNCTDGVTFNPAVDQQFYVNTSPNDSLSFTSVGSQQIIPPNEPGKPTIIKCFLILKIQDLGVGAGKRAYYDKLICNGREYDISALSLTGDSLGDDYTNGCNILLQAVNRPTNYVNASAQGNHFRAFFHQVAFGYQF
jgi:hypothetical protein